MTDPPFQRLTIWLFNPYGPLPDEGWRDYSYVTIGSVLAAAGHDVIWWTSNFSHHFKKFRSKGWEDRRLESGLVVRLVPTTGYSRNVSLGRFFRDAVYGWRAYRRGRRLPRPDVILTSDPAMNFGYAGPRLAKHHGATLIYDQMDLWPELLVQSLPSRVRTLANALLWPVYRSRARTFATLDGAMALAQPYLQSVTRDIPADRSVPNLVIYNGIDVPTFRAAMEASLPPTLAAAIDRRGVKAIFAGSLGPSYDVGPMIAAARLLHERGAPVTIYIAGDGPERPAVQAAAAEQDNLVYLGTLPPAILPAVYARCDIGLSCYSQRSNVEMCDKFYDYTAAGLAIVNSLQGEVRDWIEGRHLGVQYVPGDAASLANRLLEVSADPAGLAAMRARSWDAGVVFDRTVQHAELPGWVQSVVRAKER